GDRPARRRRLRRACPPLLGGPDPPTRLPPETGRVARAGDDGAGSGISVPGSASPPEWPSTGLAPVATGLHSRRVATLLFRDPSDDGHAAGDPAGGVLALADNPDREHVLAIGVQPRRADVCGEPR